MPAPKCLSTERSLEELNYSEFLFFRDLIFDLAGISLSDKKIDLVRSRLRSHVQSLGFRSFAEYRTFLANAPAETLEFQNFVNLLTTNKTSFFREPEHFQYLVDYLIPAWQSSGRETLRAWCCATSTGEEPYSLALTLARHLANSTQFEILATDIDTEVLARATNGVYPLSQLAEIPVHFQERFIDFGSAEVSEWMRMGDEIHRRITFHQHNLASDSSLKGEKFDVIFCRNVLIYFSQATIKDLMIKLHSRLNDGGHLFIGHSESIQGCGHLFKTLKPSIFKKI